MFISTIFSYVYNFYDGSVLHIFKTLCEWKSPSSFRLGWWVGNKRLGGNEFRHGCHSMRCGVVTKEGRGDTESPTSMRNRSGQGADPDRQHQDRPLEWERTRTAPSPKALLERVNDVGLYSSAVLTFWQPPVKSILLVWLGRTMRLNGLLNSAVTSNSAAIQRLVGNRLLELLSLPL